MRICTYSVIACDIVIGYQVFDHLEQRFTTFLSHNELFTNSMIHKRKIFFRLIKIDLQSIVISIFTYTFFSIMRQIIFNFMLFLKNIFLKLLFIYDVSNITIINYN